MQGGKGNCGWNRAGVLRLPLVWQAAPELHGRVQGKQKGRNGRKRCGGTLEADSYQKGLGLRETKARMVWIEIATHLMTHKSQLTMAMGNTQIPMLSDSHCKLRTA